MMVEDPDVPPADEAETSMEGLGPVEAMLITWILHKHAATGSRLVTLIKKGPRGVHYFCTNKAKKDKMTAYIDALENNIRKLAQTFTQFLSSSAATGNKYVDVDNCWNRKPKLDYLDLNEEKKKKAKKSETRSQKKDSDSQYNVYKSSNDKDEDNAD
eukprot:3179099-Ditylum_brightwellii.AAC.1